MPRIPRVHGSLSWVPLKIICQFKENELGVATGFIYLHDNKPYFVTNWHNASGIDPATNKILSGSAIPDRFVVKLPIAKPHESGAEKVGWSDICFGLYKDDQQIDPVWYEHPVHGRKVDVVVFRFSEIENSGARHALDDRHGLTNFTVRPGLDAFVIGYPRGLTGGSHFPVWKRASIASEADIDLKNLPLIYVDTATREGMSGSPVYAQDVGWIMPEGKSDTKKGLIGRAERFLGVYSGRLGADDDFKAQLGFVWKESAIIEIIESIPQAEKV